MLSLFLARSFSRITWNPDSLGTPKLIVYAGSADVVRDELTLLDIESGIGVGCAMNAESLVVVRYNGFLTVYTEPVGKLISKLFPGRAVIYRILVYGIASFMRQLTVIKPAGCVFIMILTPGFITLWHYEHRLCPLCTASQYRDTASRTSSDGVTIDLRTCESSSALSLSCSQFSSSILITCGVLFGDFFRLI